MGIEKLLLIQLSFFVKKVIKISLTGIGLDVQHDLPIKQVLTLSR
jgi:hypothetical protein